MGLLLCRVWSMGGSVGFDSGHSGCYFMTMMIVVGAFEAWH